MPRQKKPTLETTTNVESALTRQRNSEAAKPKRKSISVTPEVYDLVAKIADDNGYKMSICIKALALYYEHQRKSGVIR